MFEPQSNAPEREELAEPLRQRAMRDSVIEGAFYALMVGFGELFFVADAVRLGASPLALGLVVALPLFVGSLGAIASHKIISRGIARRRVVLAGTCGQIASLALLATLDAFESMHIAGLVGLACAYHLFGQLTGVAWSSWFGELVPASERGSYFARRNRVVHTMIFLALLAAGGLLHLVEPASAAEAIDLELRGFGYPLIFAIAAIARVVSTILLARTPEPEMHRDTSVRMGSVRSALGSGTFARRVVGTTALLYFCVYLASPYFAPHMLESLEFSYLEYTAASVASVVGRVALLPTWGRLLDHFAARSSFLVAIIGIAIAPVPWLLSGHVIVIMAAQALSGIFWGGHEVSQFTMILESTEPRHRSAVFAALGAVAGVAQLAGTLLGAWIIAHAGFAVVLIVTCAARTAIALVAPVALSAGASERPHAPRRVVLMRLAGLRPSGGLTHRPFPDETPES